MKDILSRTVLLAVLVAGPALAGRVTGQWDFENAAQPYSATIGKPGSIWVAPPPNFIDQSGDVQFGTCTAFGIPTMPDGDGGVMKLPAFNPDNAIAVWHNIPANGGGSYVNQYTLVYDVLFPTLGWASFLQSNACNDNDGDFYLEPSGGLGISGSYAGTVVANTWHRIVFAVDMAATPTVVRKYLDGVLLEAQDLGSGLDGRWALYTVDQNTPTYIFADDSNDTMPVYVGAFQIRDYAMTDGEVAALGGVSKQGIAGGTGVTGQWDFENAADGLSATVGNDLVIWDRYTGGCGIFDCTQDLSATTQFGSSASFFLPDLPDGPTGVMRFDAPLPCTGYLFPHGAAANGGGTRVNQYTVIADLYYTQADYFNPIPGHDPDWTPIYQTDENNAQDAMMWIYIPDASLGDDGSYDGTLLWCLEDRWMRIVVAVDSADPTGTKVTKYVLYADGSHVGPVTQDEGPDDTEEGLDGKRTLRTKAEVGEDWLLFFTNDWPNPVYTHPGYVSSIQVRDYTMPESEVLALGGPSAAGIPYPPPSICAGDTNCDGSVTFADIDPFVGRLGCPSVAGCAQGCDWHNADINNDGAVTFADSDPFVSRLGATCN